MAGTCRVKSVKIELDHAALDRIRQRSKSELQGWARDVLQRRIEGLTPLATGELRRSADVSVTAGDKTEIWWYWKVPYAGAVETMTERGASPKTPGTIAPFAEPTIREAIQDEIAGPVCRSFGGTE